MSYSAAADAQAPVQRKGGVSVTAASSAQVHDDAAQGLTGTAQRLPHLGLIQRSFGVHDVGGVPAHIGGPAAVAADRLGAAAYTNGDAIGFRDQPDLHTAAHEAAHVVQQRRGVSLQDGIGQAGDRYERHADEVADLVTQGKSAEHLLASLGSGPAAHATQRLQFTGFDDFGQATSDTAWNLICDPDDEAGGQTAEVRVHVDARLREAEDDVVRDVDRGVWYEPVHPVVAAAGPGGSGAAA